MKLILQIINKSLSLFGLYVVLTKWVIQLAPVQRYFVNLAWKGFLSQWNLHDLF